MEHPSRGALTCILTSMTTVSLATLLAARDESLRAVRTRPTWYARALAWVRGLRWAWVMTALLATAGFTSRHGLVIGAGGAFVIGASMISHVAGWFVAGVVLIFLELRR